MDDVFPRIRRLARGHGVATRLRVWERWYGSPMDQVERWVPPGGVIADLGCGFGMFAGVCALARPGRQVWGVDVDAAKIATATALFGGLPNVRFVQGDLAKAEVPPCDCVVLYDVLHHLRDATVDRVLAEAASRLRPGGLLLVKENDTEPAAKVAVAMSVERLAIATSLTQSDPVRFRSRAAWSAAFAAAGFRVHRAEHLPARHGFFVPHSLFLASR